MHLFLDIFFDGLTLMRKRCIDIIMSLLSIMILLKGNEITKILHYDTDINKEFEANGWIILNKKKISHEIFTKNNLFFRPFL